MKITDAGLRERILQAMGDPDSTTILHAIRSSPKNAPSIAEETGVPLSSIYRKVALLRSSGLAMVKSYEITPEGKRQDLFIAAVTEVRISVSGDAVEVNLIPTPENASRIWFNLFNR